jgi:hypothetical protein
MSADTYRFWSKSDMTGILQGDRRFWAHLEMKSRNTGRKVFPTKDVRANSSPVALRPVSVEILLGKDVSHTPNPQNLGSGYLSLFSTSLKTCGLWWPFQQVGCRRGTFFFSMAQQPQIGQGLLITDTITLRHTTLSRTSPDEWSTRPRDLYLTTHNTHKR